MMEERVRASLQSYDWMESRIPARDALSVFVPSNLPCPKLVEEMAKVTESRWYPRPGGHRVVILFDQYPVQKKYDASIFALENGAWDYNECMNCMGFIQSMELCHVTHFNDPYVLLCEKCYGELVATK
jgi:hypothetical protein